MVQILNISTGIFPLNGSSQIGAPVTCLTCDGLGKLLWAGDDRVIQSNCIFKQLC